MTGVRSVWPLSTVLVSPSRTPLCGETAVDVYYYIDCGVLLMVSVLLPLPHDVKFYSSHV